MSARARLFPVGAALASVALLLIVLLPADAPRAQQPRLTGFTAPAITDTAALPGPRQPVFYRHDVHAGQYQMDCRYCHFAAEVSQHPGLPTLSTCMGCHLLAGAQLPEVQKVREAFGAGQAIEWIKVHDLPQFVQFPHMRHVKANIACQDCHGPIETMPQVYQYSSLKMGWCLDCHEQRNASTDCTVCHY
ncbi:MAG: cytochrome c3 family protein [Gemmatimonadetes bacterium]|nr:cytochrome c3 family protein [Gemmatimonadota bacterium]